MPGRRSYFVATSGLSAAQARRRQRDEWYTTSHSLKGKKFIEVDAALALGAKSMVLARAGHLQREAEIGHHSHFGRDASLLTPSQPT